MCVSVHVCVILGCYGISGRNHVNNIQSQKERCNFSFPMLLRIVVLLCLLLAAHGSSSTTSSFMFFFFCDKLRSVLSVYSCGCVGIMWACHPEHKRTGRSRPTLALEFQKHPARNTAASGRSTLAAAASSGTTQRTSHRLILAKYT